MNFIKNVEVFVSVFMRLMNLVSYIFVHQDARYDL